MEQTTIQKFQELGTRYGFHVSRSGNGYALYAQNTDHQWSEWLRYDPEKERVSYRGNTDHLNLWFYETRPDLTPEKCLAFVQKLNEVFGLSQGQQFRFRDLIDPEDWQEIAQVPDAYRDSRYLTGRLPALDERIHQSQEKTGKSRHADTKPDPIR